MANWNVGSKGKQTPRISRTSPSKTPRSYETHPGAGAKNAYGITARKVGAGSATIDKSTRSGVDKNMRLKTPQR